MPTVQTAVGSGSIIVSGAETTDVCLQATEGEKPLFPQDSSDFIFLYCWAVGNTMTGPSYRTFGVRGRPMHDLAISPSCPLVCYCTLYGPWPLPANSVAIPLFLLHLDGEGLQL